MIHDPFDDGDFTLVDYGLQEPNGSMFHCIYLEFDSIAESVLTPVPANNCRLFLFLRGGTAYIV